MLVGGLMGLGVLATLGREMLLARLFGTGPEIEHFRLAFAIPNLLGTSLGTVLVAALTPMLASFPQDSESQAAALRQAMVVTVALAATLSVAGLLTVPLQVELMAPGYGPGRQAELAPVFVALWGFFALTACSFAPRALLTVRGVVWPMASANLVLGATMALGVALLSTLPAAMHTSASLTLIAIVAASLLLLVHAAALPTGLLVRSITAGSRAGGPSIAAAGMATFAAFAGHLLSASPRLIDRAVATELTSGTVAALEYSFSVITVPGIAFGTVFVIAALPRLARAVRDGDHLALVPLARWAGISVALAAAFGLALMIDPDFFVRFLFARGAFDDESVWLTGRIIWWHALALGPMVAAIVLSQALLSVGLVRLFLLGALLRPVSKWLAVEALVPAYGVDGLAASFVVPEMLVTLLFGFAIVRWYRLRRGGPAP